MSTTLHLATGYCPKFTTSATLRVTTQRPKLVSLVCTSSGAFACCSSGRCVDKPSKLKQMNQPMESSSHVLSQHEGHGYEVCQDHKEHHDHDEQRLGSAFGMFHSFPIFICCVHLPGLEQSSQYPLSSLRRTSFGWSPLSPQAFIDSFDKSRDL